LNFKDQIIGDGEEKEDTGEIERKNIRRKEIIEHENRQLSKEYLI